MMNFSSVVTQEVPLIATKNKKKSFVVDTDGGNFSDDFWAVALLSCDDTVDIKLIVTSGGDTALKTKIFAKFLTHCGKGHIPICTGIPTEEHLWLAVDKYGLIQPCARNDDNDDDGLNLLQESGDNNHSTKKKSREKYFSNPILKPWAQHHDLSSYEGTLFHYGNNDDNNFPPLQPVVNVIEENACLTYLVLGSASNVEVLLDRDVDLFRRHGVRIVSMGGSLEKGPEHNFELNPAAARKMCRASDNVTLVPMDVAMDAPSNARLTLCDDRKQQETPMSTYGTYLSGDSQISLAMAQLELNLANYGSHKEVVDGSTDIIFDCIAAFVATQRKPQLYHTEQTSLTITEDGRLVPIPDNESNKDNSDDISNHCALNNGEANDISNQKDVITVNVMKRWTSDGSLQEYLRIVANTIAKGKFE